MRAFLQGLDFHDSKLLARCLNMDHKELDQVARVGLARSEPKARVLQEEGLVDSLLDVAGVGDLQAFVLACRFLTRLRSPGSEVLDRVASGSDHSSPLGDRVLSLCCGSGNTSEFPVNVTLQNLLVLEPWLYRHQQEQRWYDLMSFLLDHLAALLMLSRTNPSAPERIRKQAEQARTLLPWVLQQDGLRIDGRQHRGGDYLVRRALDALMEFDSWKAEARLRDWYRNWLALPSVYDRLPEPQFTEQGPVFFQELAAVFLRWQAFHPGPGTGRDRATSDAQEPPCSRAGCCVRGCCAWGWRVRKRGCCVRERSPPATGHGGRCARMAEPETS